VEQLGAEAAVVQLQVLGVVAVPDAGAQEHDVAGAELLAAGQGPLDGLPPGDDGDLDEAVRVVLLQLLVDPGARIGENALGEVRPAPRGDGHRDLAHGPRVPRRTSEIILCY
jgi:hypothetical protein